MTHLDPRANPASPEARPSAASPSVETGREDTSADRHRILVVDDEAITREGLATFLRDELGYLVEVAEDGARALEIARQSPIDLALTDLSMPNVSGGAFIEALRDHRPDVKVAVITASGVRDPGRHAVNLGVHQYFCKPVDLDVLGRRIGELLETGPR